jgi:hypothetical protein
MSLKVGQAHPHDSGMRSGSIQSLCCVLCALCFGFVYCARVLHISDPFCAVFLCCLCRMVVVPCRCSRPRAASPPPPSHTTPWYGTHTQRGRKTERDRGRERRIERESEKDRDRDPTANTIASDPPSLVSVQSCEKGSARYGGTLLIGPDVKASLHSSTMEHNSVYNVRWQSNHHDRG